MTGTGASGAWTSRNASGSGTPQTTPSLLPAASMSNGGEEEDGDESRGHGPSRRIRSHRPASGGLVVDPPCRHQYRRLHTTFVVGLALPAARGEGRWRGPPWTP